MTSFLCYIYLLLPFQIALNPSDGFDVASVRIIIPIIIIAWLIHSLATKKLFIANTIQTPLILSFLFLCTFSLIGAHEASWGLRKLLFLFSFFPLYFALTAILDTHAKILRLSKYIVYGAFFLALTAIAQFLLQFIFPLETLFIFWTTYILPLFLGNTFAQSVAQFPSVFVNIGGQTLMRAVAIFPDPHMLAFYLGMSAPLAFGLALEKTIRSQWTQQYVFVGMGLTILLADLLTFSRGGYLGLLGGLLSILIVQYVQWKQKTRRLFFTSLIVIIILLFTSPIGARIASSFNFQEGSNQGRIAMWQAASHTISERPFLGTGLGNYSLSVLPSASYRDPIYAHNLFLDIAAETGILNAIIFIMLVFTSINALYCKSKTQSFYFWPAVSLIIFTAHSLVETPLYSVHILPLFLFLICIAVTRTDCI